MIKNKGGMDKCFRNVLGFARVRENPAANICLLLLNEKLCDGVCNLQCTQLGFYHERSYPVKIEHVH